MTPRLADLQASFVAPPRVTYSRPRDVELTAAGRALVGLAALLVVAAVAAGLLMQGEAVRQAANRRALVETGVMVSGEVTRLWRSGDDGRRVEYRFEAGGRVYSGRARVSEARRRTLQVGSPIPVRYVPANPAVHDLGSTPRGGRPVWLPAVVFAALAAGGAACLVAVARQRRLLMDGRLAPAVVTGHKTQKTQHGTHRSLMFDFVLPSGRVESGRSATSKAPPAVGTALCVVYDPDHPRRHRVYPFPLVRPV
jgi:hypothetical protein